MMGIHRRRFPRRRRVGLRSAAIRIAFAVLSVTLAGAQATASFEDRLAETTLDEATRLIAEGRLDEALGLVERAARVAPENAELRLVAGTLLDADQARRREAQDHLQRAIELALSADVAEEATLQLAQSLITTREAERALRLLESVERDAVSVAIEVRARVAADDRWRGAETIRLERAAAPGDVVIAAADWMRTRRVGIAFLEWIDSAIPLIRTAAERRAVASAVGHAALHAHEDALARSLFDRYVSLGGDDAAVLAHFEADDRRVTGAIETGDLVVAAITGALPPADGTAFVDLDRDGSVEEEYVVRGGAIAEWTQDRDQDGRPEARVVWAEEVMLVAFRDGSSRVAVRYRSYPLADEIVIVGSNGDVRQFRPVQPISVDVGLAVSGTPDVPIGSPPMTATTRVTLEGGGAIPDRIRGRAAPTTGESALATFAEELP